MRGVLVLAGQATIPGNIGMQDYGKSSGQAFFHWIATFIRYDNYLHINAKRQC